MAMYAMASPGELSCVPVGIGSHGMASSVPIGKGQLCCDMAVVLWFV